MHSSIISKYPVLTKLSKAAASVALWISILFSPQFSLAQTALESGAVQPMGQWLAFEETDFTGNPVSVHLRTGYERAVIMPEPVIAHANNPLLPKAEVFVEKRVVGFYPEQSFNVRLIKFVGVNSGSVYELLIESSANGTRQPLKINR